MIWKIFDKSIKKILPKFLTVKKFAEKKQTKITEFLFAQVV